LEVSNPIRIGTCLNASIFFHDVVGDEEEAIRIASECRESAVDAVSLLNDQEYRDSAILLEIIGDHLQNWGKK